MNRMHPSSDPDRGLRIDFTDKKNPILSGAVGLRAHRVSAWFDNIVVLPVDVPGRVSTDSLSSYFPFFFGGAALDSGFRECRRSAGATGAYGSAPPGAWYQ